MVHRMMDTTFLLVIIGLLLAGLAAGIFVIFFVLMRRQSVSPDIAPTQELSELRGQLSQLTQLSQQQQQGQQQGQGQHPPRSGNGSRSRCGSGKSCADTLNGIAHCVHHGC